VVAPAAGRVAFAGPFRRRAGLVVIDHGKGWATLLTDVRPSVRVGDRVARGQGIGRALGPIGVELFRDGKAEPAALLAR
jgi:septal ring factor EnvC (AmiA/AmiB activator)